MAAVIIMVRESADDSIVGCFEVPVGLLTKEAEQALDVELAHLGCTQSQYAGVCLPVTVLPDLKQIPGLVRDARIQQVLKEALEAPSLARQMFVVTPVAEEEVPVPLVSTIDEPSSRRKKSD